VADNSAVGLCNERNQRHILAVQSLDKISLGRRLECGYVYRTDSSAVSLGLWTNTHTSTRRITPQFSGRVTPCEARRERILKWRARAVAATPCPLQLLVRRRQAGLHDQPASSL